jgi:hypothetical protein
MFSLARSSSCRSAIRISTVSTFSYTAKRPIQTLHRAYYTIRVSPSSLVSDPLRFHRRAYQTAQPGHDPPPPSAPPKPLANPQHERLPPSAPQQKDGEVITVSAAQQRKMDWSIIWKMMEHVWPPNWGVRARVLLGVGLLVAGKVSTVFLHVCVCTCGS